MSIRGNLRKRIDTQKVTFNNFSKGMEYDNFAKDPSNPRVQYIKNLNIENGKLELRKPAVPFIRDGQYNMPLLDSKYNVLQVFFFPSLNNDTRFLWLVSEGKGPTYKEYWVTKAGEKDFTIAEHDTAKFGKWGYKQSGVYLQYLDTLFVKCPIGIAKITIDSSKTIIEEAVSEYAPKGWELIDTGVNLYNKDPFDIKNAISGSAASYIDALMWFKKDGNRLVPAIGIKRSDFLYLKARLDIARESLITEAAHSTELLYTTRPTDSDELNKWNDKYDKYLPTFKWYSKSPTDTDYKEVHNAGGRMPLSATDILFEPGTMTAEQITKLNDLKASWADHRADILTVGTSGIENTQYKLEITYSDKYLVEYGFSTLNDLVGVASDVKVTVNDGLANKKWMYYPGNNAIRDVLSDTKRDLFLSNWHTNFGNNRSGVSDTHVAAEKISIEFTNPIKARGMNLYRKVGLSQAWGAKFRNATLAHQSWKDGHRTPMSYLDTNPMLVEEHPYPSYFSSPISLTDKTTRTVKYAFDAANNGELSYDVIQLPDKYKYDPVIEVTVEIDGTPKKYRPLGNKWFPVESSDTKLFMAEQKGYFSGISGAKDTHTNELRDHPRDFKLQFKGWSWPSENDPIGHDNPNEFQQRNDDIIPNANFTLSNVTELDSSGLIGAIPQYIPFGSPRITQRPTGMSPDIAPKIKKIDIWLANDKNLFKYNWQNSSYVFTTGGNFGGGIGSYVADEIRNKDLKANFLFSTYIINKIEIEADQHPLKPDPLELSGVVLKYSDLRYPITDFTWDLDRSRYLFQYWERLGVYGFDKEPGVSKPYNYIMLSEPDNLSYFPNTNILDVYSNDAHLITKVLPWKNNLLGFTESSTTMFIGRDGSQKETISTTTGLSEFNRDTAQVVSNSVVFKSGSAVYAFVPAPGTDNAASLNIREISRQISDLVKKLDNENPISLFSTVYKHEYWLAYRFKDKTVILKYSWDNFAWTVAEYDNEYTELFQYDASTIIAVDTLGHLYNLTSLKVEDDVRYVVQSDFRNGNPELTGALDHDIPGYYRDIKLEAGSYTKQDPSSQGSINAQAIQVEHVYDGDTFTAKDGTRYRILGMNTPEIKGSTEVEKEMAIRSRDHLKELLKDATSVTVIPTGNMSYDRKIAKISITKYGETFDVATRMLKEGYARRDFISSLQSSKYYYADANYITQLSEAEKDAMNAQVGIWANLAIESVQATHLKYFGFTPLVQPNLIGAEWTPKHSEINYEFILGNRKTSVDNNMMTEEVTVLVGEEGNHSSLKDGFVGIYTDNKHMGDFWFDNSYEMTTGDLTDEFHNWRIGSSTYETPTIQGHTFKIRKSATTINIKIEGTIAHKIYLDAVQFKFRETNRRTR